LIETFEAEFFGDTQLVILYVRKGVILLPEEEMSRPHENHALLMCFQE